MKRIVLRATLALAGAFMFTSLTAQVSQYFNTSISAPTLSDVKPYLQQNCWMFTNMNVNANGWDPEIEGDGAMVSGSTSLSPGNAGFYTPVLDIPGTLGVFFKYKFDSDVTNISWLNFYLTDPNNNIIVQLAGFSLARGKADFTYTYETTFSNLPSGAYKLHIEYEAAASTRIAIDEFKVTVPFLYTDGCNRAPVAANDIVAGLANRTASGNVKLNDSDPNGDSFNTYLITNSPDGTVVLHSTGNFTFTPNAGFTGSSTFFEYRVCDQGFGPVCGNTAKVIINFAGGMLPVKLSDFTVSVNDGNDAILRWTTTYEQGSSHFEIERSFDGATFEVVGNVKAAGNAFSKKDYAFTDKLSKSVTSKKDIYYRLRLVDQNNRAEASKILVLRFFKTNSLKMVSVMPNPVVNDINVQVQLKENSYVVIKVTGNNGAEVARKSIKGNEGLNVFSLDGTSKLPPGMYMLEVIINSNERMAIKLIKN